jgi:hypothetical protein
MRRWVLGLLCLPVLLGAGLRSSTPVTTASFEGKVFASVELLPGGLTPHGMSRMHWRVAFTAGHWSWTHEDIAEQGDYVVHADRSMEILAPHRADSIHASYDADNQRLLWQDEWYALTE